MPRCRVLRFRRDRGSDCGLDPVVGPAVDAVAGTVSAGNVGTSTGTAGAAVPAAAGDGDCDGEGAGGPVGETGVLACCGSPPRIRTRAGCPASSTSVSSAGGVGGVGAASTAVAGDPGLAAAGRAAVGRRSMGVRGRCGCTPRGGAGFRWAATGRGVGELFRVGACGAGAVVDGVSGSVPSTASSHGFAGMGMPPDAGVSTRAPGDAAATGGRTLRGALISPVKFAIRPCDSGSWAIPVGRMVTAYAPAGSTLVVMGVMSGRRGAIDRKSPR